MENLTPWQEYKRKLGDTRPWDMLNPNVARADDITADYRMSLCKKCPELLALTKQCKKCGCVMPVKVKLEASSCPIGKW